MALARAHVWGFGDLLKSADLNGEFNNILLNPISLISPTTGAIDFNLQANTNLVLENVATTPAVASSGRIVFNNTLGLPQVDQGGVVHTVPLVLATMLTTGSLLVYTSSGAFSMIPIGSSGQVLTVTSSNSSPSYAAAAAAGSGGISVLGIGTTSTAINNSTALNTFLTVPNVSITSTQELRLNLFGTITIGVASSMTVQINCSSATLATLGVPLNAVVSTVGEVFEGYVFSTSLGILRHEGAANAGVVNVTTSGTVDMTTTKTITVTFAFNSASASNTFTPYMAKLYKVG